MSPTNGRPSTGDVLGDGHRRIVRRGDHDRLQHLAERERLALREIDLRAADAARPRGRIDRLVERRRPGPHALHRDQDGHHLRHRRGRPVLVRLVLGKHRPRVGVHHDPRDGRRRRDPGRRLPTHDRRGQRRQHHPPHPLPPLRGRRAPAAVQEPSAESASARRIS
jgi:hypothetical protein